MLIAVGIGCFILGFIIGAIIGIRYLVTNID